MAKEKEKKVAGKKTPEKKASTGKEGKDSKPSTPTPAKTPTSPEPPAKEVEKKEPEQKKDPAMEAQKEPQKEPEKVKQNGSEAKHEAQPSTPAVEAAHDDQESDAELRDRLMSEPKKGVRLTYFNGTGRAELARLVMAVAKVDFEDRRIGAREWDALKPATPFRQVPVLEYHGTTIGQSMSIARFLAKKADLYGKDAEQQALVDSVVDYVNDYNAKWLSVFRASSFDDQVDQIGSLFMQFLPIFFGNLTKLLKKSGGKYFTGNELTYADLYVFIILHAFTDPSDPFFVTLPYVNDRLVFLEDFPTLAEHKAAVYEIPEVRKWIDHDRPEGLF